MELLLPHGIEVAINGLGPLLGLAHLNGDVRIAGSRLVLRLKSLCTNDCGQTKTSGRSVSATETLLAVNVKILSDTCDGDLG